VWISRLVAACGALLIAGSASASPRLTDIAVQERGQETVVILSIEGSPLHRDVHMLRDHRLVLDLPGVVPSLRSHQIEGGTTLLRRIRVGVHADPKPRTRVVFDLNGPSEFAVRPRASGLEVFLGAPGSTPLVPSSAADATAPPPSPTPIRAGTPTDAPTAATMPAPTASPTSTPTPTATSGPMAPPTASREALEPSPAHAPAGSKPVPAGVVTIDFHDADVRTVIDLVANVGGYDVIFTPEVRGLLTIRIVDRPWEEALQTILDEKDLRATRHADLILVSPAELGSRAGPAPHR